MTPRSAKRTLQEYVLTTEKECSRVVLPPGITPADQISLQLTGLTAMVGIFNIGLGNFKPGSTVLVSGAAGSTGSIAGQVYKHALGCRVVGTAGGPEKCNFVKQVLGFDECVDYKDPNYESNLKAACPKGIKEYFDNVGSRTLELALDLLTQGGRVVLCGGIAEYESASPKGPSNYLNLIVKRLRMEGFVFTDHARSFPSHMKKLHQLIGSGKLKIVNDVRTGLENAGDSLKDLFAGKNFGKMMVKL